MPTGYTYQKKDSGRIPKEVFTGIEVQTLQENTYCKSSNKVDQVLLDITY